MGWLVTGFILVVICLVIRIDILKEIVEQGRKEDNENFNLIIDTIKKQMENETKIIKTLADLNVRGGETDANIQKK